MGMYDTFRYKGKEYQSKDLDCELCTYDIKGGKLKYHNEVVDYTGMLHIYGDDGVADVYFKIMCGTIIRVSDKPIEIINEGEETQMTEEDYEYLLYLKLKEKYGEF